MKVSYCSTCKGRLSQLKRTLMPNLSSLSDVDAEWIIVDYGCPDKTKEALLELPLVKEYLDNGKLKVYSFTKDIPFNMPLSKNLSHFLASGDIVFNLDIDNYIGDSFPQISKLSSKEYMSNSLQSSGYAGRIGMYKSVFDKLGGYDLDLDVAGYDDINMLERLSRLKLKSIKETGVRFPVLNTVQDTIANTGTNKTPIEIYQNSKRISDEKLSKGNIFVNPKGSLFFNDEDMSKYLERVL